MNLQGAPIAMPRIISPRLSILLATKAPHGVIFRRGPSRVTCTIGWDRRTDTFTLGQWVKARIFVRRSDISPDGKHVIYFASDYGRALHTWTAISRAPYLKAVVLYGKGDSWNGGGLFTANNRFWLNDSEEFEHHRLVHNLDRRLVRDPICPWAHEGSFDGVDTEFRRLMRDGWRWIGGEQLARRHDVRTLERQINSQWTLQKAAHSLIPKKQVLGRGTRYDAYSIKHRQTGDVEEHPDWDWADVDRRRLVWTAGGKLLTGHLAKDGLDSIRTLHDFNGMTFEPIKAPY